MFLLFAALEVMTLHCEAYDIASGQREGPAVAWTITVDTGQDFSYSTGDPIYSVGTGVADTSVTPDAIIIPRHSITPARTVQGVRVSRVTGQVDLRMHDLNEEFDDVVARNGLNGRAHYVGLCERGELVPVPRTRF